MQPLICYNYILSTDYNIPIKYCYAYHVCVGVCVRARAAIGVGGYMPVVHASLSKLQHWFLNCSWDYPLHRAKMIFQQWLHLNKSVVECEGWAWM
jgi:hypothetical protein